MGCVVAQVWFSDTINSSLVEAPDGLHSTTINPVIWHHMHSIKDLHEVSSLHRHCRLVLPTLAVYRCKHQPTTTPTPKVAAAILTVFCFDTMPILYLWYISVVIGHGGAHTRTRLSISQC